MSAVGSVQDRHAFPAPARDVTVPSSLPPSRRLAMLALLLVGVALALLQLVPPAAAPADAPATSFSAQRALPALRTLAAAPRASGLPGNARARDFIVEALRGLGLNPLVHSTPVLHRWPGSPTFRAGVVHNVVVRLPGSASTGALLFDAHYDSGTTGPGGADCGACVASLIETIRALLAGPQLRNDAIFVFADGEENGDLGAHAFATQHPWMRDVRLAVNLEAMGNRGPALLYATSSGDAAAVRGFLTAAPRPLVSSFSTAFLGMFPSQRGGCDLDEYADRGVLGLGFIIAGNTAAYHTALDDFEHIDGRSVQHLGESALAAARHFGDVDLSALGANEDGIFFNLLPGLAATVGVRGSRAAAIVALASLALLLGAGFAQRRLRPVAVVVGVTVAATAVIAATAFAGAAWWLLRAIDPDLQVFLIGHPVMGAAVAGLLLLAAGVAAAIVLAALDWLRPVELTAGALLVLAAAGLTMLLVIPGASYLTGWPLLLTLPAFAWLVVRNPGAHWGWIALLGAAAIGSIGTLLPPAIYPLAAYMARFEAFTALPLLALTGTLSAMLVVALTPQLATLAGEPDDPWRARGRAAIAGVPLIAGIAVLAAVPWATGFDRQNPRPNRVVYEQDVDRGSAEWTSPDRRLDAWSASFFGAEPVRMDGRFRAPAPVASWPPPVLETLEDVGDDDGRRLIVRVRSPRGALSTLVELSAGAPITAVRVDGIAAHLGGYAPAENGRLRLMHFATAPQGFVLELSAGAGPIRVMLADEGDGYPRLPGITIPPRPDDTMPAPGTHPEATVVRRTIVLE